MGSDFDEKSADRTEMYKSTWELKFHVEPLYLSKGDPAKHRIDPYRDRRPKTHLMNVPTNSYLSLYILAAAMLLLAYADCAAAQQPFLAQEHAADKFRTELILESAYLFYMAAELAILFLIVKARNYFESRPLPDRFSITAHDKRALTFCTAFVTAVAVLLFGRHVFIAPMPAIIANIGATEPDRVSELIANAYALRAHIHLAVFFLFLIAWIILESAIVWQGLRAYRHMRKVIV